MNHLILSIFITEFKNYISWVQPLSYVKELLFFLIKYMVSNANAEDIFYPSKQHKKTIACGIFSIICSMMSTGIT